MSCTRWHKSKSKFRHDDKTHFRPQLLQDAGLTDHHRKKCLFSLGPIIDNAIFLLVLGTIDKVATQMEHTVVLATGWAGALGAHRVGTLDGQEPGAQKRNPTMRSMTDGSACTDWSCVARRASALFPRGSGYPGSVLASS